MVEDRKRMSGRCKDDDRGVMCGKPKVGGEKVDSGK